MQETVGSLHRHVLSLRKDLQHSQWSVCPSEHEHVCGMIGMLPCVVS